MAIALMEVVFGPPVSWFGYSRRRTALMTWLLIPAVAILLLLPIPTFNPPPGNGKFSNIKSRVYNYFDIQTYADVTTNNLFDDFL